MTILIADNRLDGGDEFHCESNAGNPHAFFDVGGHFMEQYIAQWICKWCGFSMTPHTWDGITLSSSNDTEFLIWKGGDVE